MEIEGFLQPHRKRDGRGELKSIEAEIALGNHKQIEEDKWIMSSVRKK